MLSKAWAYVVALGGVAASVVAIYLKGRSDNKRDAESKDNKRKIEAHDKRREIEGDIQQDVDLYRRAVDSGVVRPKG